MVNFQQLPQLVDLRGKTASNGSYKNVGVNAKTHVVIHHSLTKSGDSAAYANYHVNTHGWPGIGYHFVILKDGSIEWNHDLGVRSYHVGNHNKYSVGICLTGDFRHEQPTKAQIKSLYDLINELKKDLPQYKKTLGHSDLEGYEWKPCPVFDYNKVLFDYYLEIREANDVSEWAKDAYHFIKDNNISDGTKPKEPVTREEVWTMLYRFYKGVK